MILQQITELAAPTHRQGPKARQQFFMSRLQRLVCLRVLYPSVRREAGWHRPRYTALNKSDQSLFDWVLRESDEQESQVDLLILSYEDVCQLKEPHSHWLKDSLPDLTAVVLLLRQDQLINSLHNQLYKSSSHNLPETGGLQGSHAGL